MKNLIRLALSCALMGLAHFSAQAQSPVANFVADTTNGATPLIVNFTNQSTNATNYSWDFGDGNTTTNATPSHTYTNSGIYTVALSAIGSGETNVFSIPNYITVTPNALFAADVAFGAPPLKVGFRTLVSGGGGATNYFWDFGDGNTSTESAPTNTYVNAGTYDVSLTVVGAGGSNTFSITNYIHVGTETATNILLNASFSFSALTQGIIGNTNFVLLTAKPIKITSKDIINSIGRDIGKGTNNLKDAKLLLRITQTASGGSSGFLLRQGTNDTDISKYLQLQVPAQFVQNGFASQYRTVTTERDNAKAGVTNTIDYTIAQFLLGTQNGSFSVQGSVKLTSSSLLGKGREVLSGKPVPLALRADLAGTGLAGGTSAVFRGTFTAAGRKVEVKQVPLSAQ